MQPPCPAPRLQPSALQPLCVLTPHSACPPPTLCAAGPTCEFPTAAAADLGRRRPCVCRAQQRSAQSPLGPGACAGCAISLHTRQTTPPSLLIPTVAPSLTWSLPSAWQPRSSCSLLRLVHVGWGPHRCLWYALQALLPTVAWPCCPLRACQPPEEVHRTSLVRRRSPPPPPRHNHAPPAPSPARAAALFPRARPPLLCLLRGLAVPAYHRLVSWLVFGAADASVDEAGLVKRRPTARQPGAAAAHAALGCSPAVARSRSRQTSAATVQLVRPAQVDCGRHHCNRVRRACRQCAAASAQARCTHCCVGDGLD